MRAFAEQGKLIFLLLLLLLSSRPLTSVNNISEWRTVGACLDPGPAMVVEESGFCRIGDEGRLAKCSSGFIPECAADEREDVTQKQGKAGPAGPVDEVGDEYIVRFRSYRQAADHKRELEDNLEGSGRDWQWLERINPASAFPTDFGLLKIERSRYEGLVRALRNVKSVKDVSPQMRFTRSLTSEGDDDSEGQHPPGADQNDDEGHTEKIGLDELRDCNPQGRLHTKMSFESGYQDSTDSRHANVSLHQSRKLLLQVT